MPQHSKTATVDPAMLDLVMQEGRSPLIATLFQTFLWLDRNLQQNLVERGWAPASRTESQILLLVGSGVTRQKDIARVLGLSPQAVNQSSLQLLEKGLIALEPDPADRRQRIIVIPPDAMKMHLDAAAILAGLESEIANRIGGVARLGRLDRLLADITMDACQLEDREVDGWVKAILSRLDARKKREVV